jgi:hypothetical protein
VGLCFALTAADAADPEAPQPPTASSGTGASTRKTVRRDHPVGREASGAVTL